MVLSLRQPQIWYFIKYFYEHYMAIIEMICTRSDPLMNFFFLDIQGAEHPKLVLNAKIKPDFVLLMQIRSKCFLGLISLMQCIVSVMMKQSTKALEILEHQIFYAQ
jgi:hypothetical protein